MSVYKITSPSTDLVYFGSTTQKLNSRFAHHKSKYNSCSSKQIIQFGDAQIELLETVEDSKQLHELETFYIDNFDCVNKYTPGIPGRTQEQWYQDNKEYCNNKSNKNYKNNKEEILEQMKDYYENNKEEILEQMKDYYQNNKEEIIERVQDYYQNNKEEILEYKKEKIICECGCSISRSNIQAHRKTQKHLNLLLVE